MWIVYLPFRWQQIPTTSQPHRPSCSSGTQCEWTTIREQTAQMWRRRSNNTQKTTQETVATRTFQRDTWVLDASQHFLCFLFGGTTICEWCYDDMVRFSDGPHAFCQQSRLWVPEREWRLWLWQLLKQGAVLPGVWLRWAGISCLAQNKFIVSFFINFS